MSGTVVDGRAHSSIRALLLAALAAGALLIGAWAASAAEAATPFQRAKSVKLKPGARITRAIAACPRGSGVVSGGFRTFRPDLEAKQEAHVIVSRRLGQRRWLVSAQTGSETTRRARITAYAYCLDGIAGARTKVAKRRYQLPSDQFGHHTVTARCPAGTRAISGGFATPPATSKAVRVISESRRAGARRWRASVLVSAIDDAAGSSSVTAYAYCARRAGRTRIRRRSRPLPIAFDGTVSVTARCRKRDRVTAGGFRADPVIPPAERLSLATIFESRRLGLRRWRTSAVQLAADDDNGRSRVVSFAACA